MNYSVWVRGYGLVDSPRVQTAPFNVKGNDYRLVAAVHYNRGMMFIRFVGTHREYDKIDAGTI